MCSAVITDDSRFILALCYCQERISHLITRRETGERIHRRRRHSTYPKHHYIQTGGWSHICSCGSVHREEHSVLRPVLQADGFTETRSRLGVATWVADFRVDCWQDKTRKQAMVFPVNRHTCLAAPTRTKSMALKKLGQRHASTMDQWDFSIVSRNPCCSFYFLSLILCERYTTAFILHCRQELLVS